MASSSRVATLRRKATLVQEGADQLASSCEELTRYAEQAISTLEEQIQTLQAKLSVLGLNMPALRNAICTDMNAAAQPWCPTVIATLGSGPWEASEYDYFLQDRAFEPVEAPHTGVDGLIVGANDWSADVLSRQIYDRDSSTLRVYTQELFVVGMVIGEDPYDALDQEAIEEIANSHPAIQFILARDFSWPVAAVGDAEKVEREDDGHDWNEESALRVLGYSARSGGPSESARRQHLKQAFESVDLSGVETREQKRCWGPAYSAQRLYAISRFIHWLIDFQGPNRPDAKVKWAADLDWLKRGFYKPTMRFIWSATHATSSTPEPAKKARGVDAAFMKAMTPSGALAAVIGAGPLPRSEVVSRLWTYIKKNNLQDSVNKRMINADPKLRGIFGKAQVSMFEMAGLIGQHLR